MSEFYEKCGTFDKEEFEQILENIETALNCIEFEKNLKNADTNGVDTNGVDTDGADTEYFGIEDFGIEDSYTDGVSVEDEVTFEDLKNFNSKNLRAGRQKVEEERATYETETAAAAYKTLKNTKERLERELKRMQEQLDEVNTHLKMFDEKPKKTKQ